MVEIEESRVSSLRRLHLPHAGGTVINSMSELYNHAACYSSCRKNEVKRKDEKRTKRGSWQIKKGFQKSGNRSHASVIRTYGFFRSMPMTPGHWSIERSWGTSISLVHTPLMQRELYAL